MINEKKRITDSIGGIITFSVSIVICLLTLILLDFNKHPFLWVILVGLSAIFSYSGLCRIFQYCAYDSRTLFVCSFFKCKEINFKDIKSIEYKNCLHTYVNTDRNGNTRKEESYEKVWFVWYWDKKENCEKFINPSFCNAESEKMQKFFATLKAVNPCKISFEDDAENSGDDDDFLDALQGDVLWEDGELDGIAGVSFKGSVYVTFEMKRVRMKKGDLSALKKVLLEDIDFKNSLNEGDEEADENCLGISENDKLELISVDDSMTDIKALGEECRILETMPVCNMVKKADGYYKIFKNGTEYASADVKYRVAKHGSKYVLFYFVFYNDEPQKSAVLRGYPIAY